MNHPTDSSEAMRLRVLTGIMRLAMRFNWTAVQLRSAMALVDGEVNHG